MLSLGIKPTGYLSDPWNSVGIDHHFPLIPVGHHLISLSFSHHTHALSVHAAIWTSHKTNSTGLPLDCTIRTESSVKPNIPFLLPLIPVPKPIKPLCTQ